jgi:hypothetical protein
MRLQRVLVGVLGAALLGALPVALTSTSANAGAPIPVASKVVIFAKPTKVWGSTLLITGQVQDSAGTGYLPDSPDGYVTLKRRKAGTSTWTTLGTYQNESNFRFSTTARFTATYQVVYSGGNWTNPDDGQAYTFGSSSGTRTFTVSRNLHGKAVKAGGKLYYRGNVDPGWGRKPVTIQKKACKSCGWKSYKTVRTSRYGAYSVRISAPRSGRWFWRSTVRATSPTFVRAYGTVYYTYSTRTPARTLAGGIGR